MVNIVIDFLDEKGMDITDIHATTGFAFRTSPNASTKFVIAKATRFVKQYQPEIKKIRIWRQYKDGARTVGKVNLETGMFFA